jgi:integrase
VRPKDIDLDSGTVVVQHGKGDKRRVVGLDPGTAALVTRWLDLRRKRGVNGRAPVFCTLDEPRSTSPMSVTSFPDSLSGLESISASMRTLCVTPTQSNLNAREPQSARSATCSATRP